MRSALKILPPKGFSPEAVKKSPRPLRLFQSVHIRFPPHIGQGDMGVKEARKILGPDKIIGVSARTVEQARKAQEEGADYLGSGAVFQTGTKGDAKPLFI